MMRSIIFTGIGYFSGSILFASVCSALLKKNIVCNSPDQNPGTFNAFRYGGFLCGALTLCGDLLKGFLPVALYLDGGGVRDEIGLAFVLAAPVFGHVLPLFYKFRGGKGIAVSFGCLLGLLPEYLPVVILAACFLFFTLFLKITPHYHRTLFTYVISAICMEFLVPEQSISFGFLLVAGLILLKLLFSDEKKEVCKVKLAWKH